MKVAVTGASGFVGSHVLEALAERSDVEIVAIARGSLPSERLPPKAEQAELDLHAAGSDAYEQMGRPDLVMHFAWSGLPNYLSPAHLEHELPAQWHFLRSLVEAGLPSLLVSGTCYEYGMVEGELGEDMPALPANSYASAKVALYEQLEALRREKPFALTWARLFYLWGPRQAPGSLYSLIRSAVERGDRAFAMSPGDQLRDYLPVETAARLLVELALRAPGAGIVNLCSGVPIAVRTLVEGWVRDKGWDIALDPGKLDYPSYEPRNFWGSNRKLDALLGKSKSETRDGFS